MGRLRLRWSGCPAAQPHGELTRLAAELTLPEGAHQDLVLELSQGALDDRAPDPDRLWAATETAWQQAMPTLGGTIAPRDAQHAYAVLRGLTSASGGMVAAATHEPARTR